MRRISDEDGMSAGWRNWGRFMLAAIPAALGGGAILWIMAAMGWIDLTRQIRMQQRALVSVGITAPPKDPIRLVTKDSACLRVESSWMDGNRITFYAVNTCDRGLDLPNYSLRATAHDGTVIDSERWAFSGDLYIGPKERREQRTTFDSDDRIETVELSVIDGR